MPAAQPIPNDSAPRKPAIAPLLRCQPRSALAGAPDRALARGLVALFHRLARDRGNVCAGCPIIPGVPDRAILYPTCEVCRWPAVYAGPVSPGAAPSAGTGMSTAAAAPAPPR